MIEDGPGEGQRLLPVENTSQTVDIDLIGNTMRAPERERLSLILNELGTGVAGPRPRPQRGHPARQPGAARDRQGARDPGQPEHRARAAGGQLRHRPRSRWRATARAWPARSATRATSPAPRPSGARTWPPTSRRCRSSSTSSSRRWCGSARWPTSRRRCCAISAPTRQDINNLVERQGPFAQAAIPAVDSLGEAAKVGTPAMTDARPVIARPAHAGEQRPAGRRRTCARCSSPSATRKASSA